MGIHGQEYISWSIVWQWLCGFSRLEWIAIIGIVIVAYQLHVASWIIQFNQCSQLRALSDLVQLMLKGQPETLREELYQIRQLLEEKTLWQALSQIRQLLEDAHHDRHEMYMQLEMLSQALPNHFNDLSHELSHELEALGQELSWIRSLLEKTRHDR